MQLDPNGEIAGIHSKFWRASGDGPASTALWSIVSTHAVCPSAKPPFGMSILSPVVALALK